MRFSDDIIALLAPFRPMRKPAEWMQLPVDERILELLDEAGPLQPTPISEEFNKRSKFLDYHPNTIGDRCRALQDRGFLVSTGQGVYSITERGQAYLAGELDAAEIDYSSDE